VNITLHLPFSSTCARLHSHAQILRWLVQATQALHHLHSRGMIHRDIKSANLFLTSNGLLKLGDFGIAKVLERNSDRMSARTTRTPVGTPMYMSPELCNGLPYSSKADMWAMGCVLFELCALRPAFVAQSMDMLMAKIKRGQHDRGLPRHFSVDLTELVGALLSLDERQRPSAADILKMPFLQPFVEEAPYTLLRKGRALPTVSPQAAPAPSAPPEILVIAETLKRAGRHSTVEVLPPEPRSRESTPTSSASDAPHLPDHMLDLLHDRGARDRRGSRGSLSPSRASNSSSPGGRPPPRAGGLSPRSVEQPRRYSDGSGAGLPRDGAGIEGAGIRPRAGSMSPQQRRNSDGRVMIMPAEAEQSRNRRLSLGATPVTPSSRRGSSPAIAPRIRTPTPLRLPKLD
jgi:serine/threonine protein kinase